MTDGKTLSGEDVIDRTSPEYVECMEALKGAAKTAEEIIRNIKPSLIGERYFTSEEIMLNFHISRRALQNYRDNGTIPYTLIGGIILYPESGIKQVLERNYYKPEIFLK